MYGEQVANEASSCFTEQELSMILGKTGSGDGEETLSVITARREKLERAVRRIQGVPTHKNKKSPQFKNKYSYRIIKTPYFEPFFTNFGPNGQNKH